MLICLDGVGKKYNQWIFREISFNFYPGTYGISGSNGSGKSTLLRIISGYLTPSEGTVSYCADPDTPLDRDQWPTLISYSGPDLELIEELTLQEHCTFHFGFKKILEGFSIDDFFRETDLYPYRDLRVSELSSGLSQRFELGLTFLSSNPIILLDEPTSYLDQRSRNWFFSMFEKYKRDRLVLVASNDQADLDLCGEILMIEDHLLKS